MRNPLLVPELRELLARNDTEELRNFCEDTHPAAVAEFLNALEPEEVKRILWTVDDRLRALIFSHLDSEMEVALAERLGRGELAGVVNHMLADERVDLLNRLPEEKRDAVMPALATAEREDIRRLASWEEGTAGAAMTSEYATLPPDVTVREAIERLRLEAPDKETIYYAYVLDARRRLLGMASLKDLILAPPGRRVDQIMQSEVIFSRVTDDQEAVAQKIAKYDLIALPILNDDDVLLGIVTHDDAIDILRQEHTEDMERLMGIAGEHEVGVYLRTSAWQHFRNRAGWIVGLAAVGLVTGYILHEFQPTLEHLMLLAIYMPMLANTGGNTGSQSAMVIVRSLAIGEITPKHALRVLFKELGVAVMLSTVLAVLAFGKVLMLSGDADLTGGITLVHVALTVSLALGIQVVTATLIGAMLPLVVSRMGYDPTVVTSPLLTTTVDITGLLIYFGIIRLVLGF